MVIREELTNFPTVLGPKIFPPTTIRAQVKRITSSIPLAEQASALIRGEMPVHLAQRVGSNLPPFNFPGLGSQLPAQEVKTQIFEEPILPIMDRPTPILDMIKEREPLLPRNKWIGTLGVLDPQEMRGQNNHYIGSPRSKRNLPRPYERPGTWPPGRSLSETPSVTGIISGPERTIHPQTHLAVEM